MHSNELNSVLADIAKTDKRLKDNVEQMQKLYIEYTNADFREKAKYSGRIAFLCQDTQRLAEEIEFLNQKAVVLVTDRWFV